MTLFTKLNHLAAVLACIWASTLATSPTAAQQPDSATIQGTFIMSTAWCCVGPDLAAIVARGKTHTWTLTLHGLSYSHDYEVVNPDDFYARFITRVYATSFNFQFQGPDANALNTIVSDRLINGGLQSEPFVELRNVAYLDHDWGGLGQGVDWIIAIRPIDYQLGFQFISIPYGLEYGWYSVDANGYPVLEPFTSGMSGAWALITDLRPGYAGTIGQQGGNTVSVVSINLPLPGDYNRNGMVDAADYVVWRKSPNSFGGDPGGYNIWRANLGRTSGSGVAIGSTSHSAVPEPSGLTLLTLAAPALLRNQRTRQYSLPPVSPSSRRAVHG